MLGTATVVGAGVCIFATAGACAIAGGIGLGLSVGGRVADFSIDPTKHWNSPNDLMQLGAGIGIDVAASRIPGVPTFFPSAYEQPGEHAQQ